MTLDGICMNTMACVVSIHCDGERVKAFRPARLLYPSNSKGLKFGLYNVSHKPRYSMVLRFRIQLAITPAGSISFFCRAIILRFSEIHTTHDYHHLQRNVTAIKFQVHFNRYAALIELQNIPALERIIPPDNTRYFIPFSTAPNSPNTPHTLYGRPVVSRPRYSLLERLPRHNLYQSMPSAYPYLMQIGR